jgi:hypothetical protein
MHLKITAINKQIVYVCHHSFSTYFNIMQIPQIKVVLFSSLILLNLSINAQSTNELKKLPAGDGKRSQLFKAEKIGEASLKKFDTKWQPCLSYQISKNENDDNKLLEKLKEAKLQLKLRNQNKSNSKSIGEIKDSKSNYLLKPTVGTNFGGNTNNGCPPDNSIAVSNGGYIISVQNSNIYLFDTTGFLYNNTNLVNFYNDNTLSTSLCDPKVIYDSGSDRFIFFSQTCDGQSSTSKIIISFSKTNNPTNGWWVYKITGNPLNDGSWFDYPKMGVSTDDLFVTGNLFFGSGGYNESVVYQIDKNDGFSGSPTVNWQLWSNIVGNPFTLLPLSNGQQGNYGPGIYLASTKSFGGNSIGLYHITDNLNNSPSMNFSSVVTSNYSAAADAQQSSTSYNLDGGDCRIQDGFYLNGIAHIVFHHDSANYNVIDYTRIDVNSKKATHRLIAATGFKDYAYPSIASFSTNQNDKAVAIGFLASGSTIYPEVRVKLFDNDFNSDTSIIVRYGDSFVGSNCYDGNKSAVRWGDYSGMSRLQNSALPQVWMNGCYGNFSSKWSTWIAQVKSNYQPDAISKIINPSEKLKISPNPTSNRYEISFVAKQIEQVSFQLININGQVVDELYNGLVYLGENKFSFQRNNLPNGIYFLNIINQSGKTLNHEKIIIAD